MEIILGIAVLLISTFIFLYVRELLRVARLEKECESCHVSEQQAIAAFNSLLTDNIAMSKQLVKITGLLAERAGIDLAEEPTSGLDENHPLSVAAADREAVKLARQAELRDQGFTPTKVDDPSIKAPADQVEDPEAIKMYEKPYHQQDEVEDPWPEEEAEPA